MKPMPGRVLGPARYGVPLFAPNLPPDVQWVSMVEEEDVMLKGAMRDLGEASRRIRAARPLMREHALEADPAYLGLVAHLSEALEVTEAALRAASRLRVAAG